MRRTTALATISLLASVLVGAAGTAGKPSPPSSLPPGSQEVEVVGVVIEEDAHQPAVLLEGKRDHRRLIMTIGLAEATGIAVPLVVGLRPPRPLTHDLFLTLFGRLDVALSRVVITDLRDNTYYATVHLTAASKPMKLDARPSDAIALALRAKVPVVVEDRVFDKAGTIAPRQERI
jgi:bifunctional DNase/RNase